MFRIKARNVEAFLAHEERAFEERVLRRPRDNFKAMSEWSDEDLTAFVRLGKARAAGYGIHSLYGISLYIGIMAELGEAFDRSDEHAWVAEILCHAGVDGNTKVDWICHAIQEPVTQNPLYAKEM